MKDCDVIQPELSAYVDGELTPHQRELVEAHLASCPRCREALAELKTLTAGVTALPKLETPPRFLAEVRAKITRGDHPEAPTWRDYLFRPFWIKVPLELAAVAAVTVFVVRLEVQQPAATGVGNELAQMDSGTGSAGKVPPGSVPGDLQLLGVQAKTAAAESGGGIQPAVESRRGVAAINQGPAGPVIAPTPSAAEVSALAQSVGVEPSKVGGVVVIHSRDLNDVQGRAEQLAARCNGKVIPVLSSIVSTAHVFFVEVPREYAASFKLDLQQQAATSTPAPKAIVAGGAVVATNASPLSATSTARVVGVLTGGVETNAIFDGPAHLALANNPRAQAAATTVLEILVVPPPSLAPTNTAPAPATPVD